MTHVPSDQQKTELLQSALQERYQSIHNIRARVESVGLWMLGILLGVGGWVIQTDIIFSYAQKITYILGVIFAYSVIRFSYLKDQYIGFTGQLRIAAKIEKTLGFFTPGFFDNTTEPMYPSSWEKTGTRDGDGKFFNTTYNLIAVGALFLLLAIAFNGSFLTAGH